MNRRLSLRSETLTELTAGELEAVAAGIRGTQTCICLTGHYPTIEVTYCFEIIEEITTAIAGPSSTC